jgi:hypothetical protein
MTAALIDNLPLNGLSAAMAGLLIAPINLQIVLESPGPVVAVPVIP